MMRGFDFTAIPLLSYGVGVALLLIVVALVSGFRVGTREAFHLADRTTPWPIVALSLAGTEIGVISLLLLPSLMMTWEGDLRAALGAVGALIARALISAFLLGPIWNLRVAGGPYIYLRKKFGAMGENVAQLLFLVLGVVGQGLVLGIAALALKGLLGASLLSIAATISILSIALVLQGGGRSAVWTGAFATLVLAASLTGLAAVALQWSQMGLGEIRGILQAALHFDGSAVEKLSIVDFRSNPFRVENSWTYLLVIPFLQISTLLSSHSGAQRLLACRDERAAQRALWWSSIGQLLLLPLFMLGALAFCQFRTDPPTDPRVLAAYDWRAGEPASLGHSFSVWVSEELPAPASGLLISLLSAAVVAGILPTLSAVSEVFQSPESKREPRRRTKQRPKSKQRSTKRRRVSEKKKMQMSRIGIILAGILLILVAWGTNTWAVSRYFFFVAALCSAGLVGMLLAAVISGGVMRNRVVGGIALLMAIAVICGVFLQRRGDSSSEAAVGHYSTKIDVGSTGEGASDKESLLMMQWIHPRLLWTCPTSALICLSLGLQIRKEER